MGPQEDYIETVLTCEGDYYDPEFHVHLRDFSQKLQNLITKDKGELILKKVEPWNSVKVTFNIPKEAAVRLKELAEQGDETLRELGILAIQIEGDNLISLTIAGKNNERTELVFNTNVGGQVSPDKKKVSQFLPGNNAEELLPGPSDVENTRKNIAQYLKQQGSAGPDLVDSLFGQTKTEPIETGRVPAPFPNHPLLHGANVSVQINPVRGGQVSLPSPTSLSHSPCFPSPGMTRNPGPVSPKVTPPMSQPQPTSSPGMHIPPNFPVPFPHGSTMNNMQRHVPGKDKNITSSSPLLVNLLQTDAAAHLNNFMPHQTMHRMPPPYGAGPPAKRKRKPKKGKKEGEAGDLFVPNINESAQPGFPSPMLASPSKSPLGEKFGPQHMINPFTGQMELVDNASMDSSSEEVYRHSSSSSSTPPDAEPRLQPPPNPLVALQSHLKASQATSFSSPSVSQSEANMPAATVCAPVSRDNHNIPSAHIPSSAILHPVMKGSLSGSEMIAPLVTQSHVSRGPAESTVNTPTVPVLSMSRSRSEFQHANHLHTLVNPGSASEGEVMDIPPKVSCDGPVSSAGSLPSLESQTSDSNSTQQTGSKVTSITTTHVDNTHSAPSPASVSDISVNVSVVSLPSSSGTLPGAISVSDKTVKSVAATLSGGIPSVELSSSQAAEEEKKTVKSPVSEATPSSPSLSESVSASHESVKTEITQPIQTSRPNTPAHAKGISVDHNGQADPLEAVTTESQSEHTGNKVPVKAAIQLSNIPAIPSLCSNGAAVCELPNNVHQFVTRESNGASTAEASPMSSETSSVGQYRAGHSPLQNNNLGSHPNHDSELSSNSFGEQSPVIEDSTEKPLVMKDVKEVENRTTECLLTNTKNVLTVGYALGNHPMPKLMDGISNHKLEKLQELPYLSKVSSLNESMLKKGVVLKEDLKDTILPTPISAKGIFGSKLVSKHEELEQKLVESICVTTGNVEPPHSSPKSTDTLATKMYLNNGDCGVHSTMTDHKPLLNGIQDKDVVSRDKHHVSHSDKIASSKPQTVGMPISKAATRTLQTEVPSLKCDSFTENVESLQSAEEPITDHSPTLSATTESKSPPLACSRDDTPVTDSAGLARSKSDITKVTWVSFGSMAVHPQPIPSTGTSQIVTTVSKASKTDISTPSSVQNHTTSGSISVESTTVSTSSGYITTSAASSTVCSSVQATSLPLNAQPLITAPTTSLQDQPRMLQSTRDEGSGASSELAIVSSTVTVTNSEVIPVTANSSVAMSSAEQAETSNVSVESKTCPDSDSRESQCVSKCSPMAACCSSDSGALVDNPEHGDPDQSGSVKIDISHLAPSVASIVAPQSTDSSHTPQASGPSDSVSEERYIPKSEPTVVSDPTPVVSKEGVGDSPVVSSVTNVTAVSQNMNVRGLSLHSYASVPVPTPQTPSRTTNTESVPTSTKSEVVQAPIRVVNCTVAHPTQTTVSSTSAEKTTRTSPSPELETSKVLVTQVVESRPVDHVIAVSTAVPRISVPAPSLVSVASSSAIPEPTKPRPASHVSPKSEVVSVKMQSATASSDSSVVQTPDLSSDSEATKQGPISKGISILKPLFDKESDFEEDLELGPSVAKTKKTYTKTRKPSTGKDAQMTNVKSNASGKSSSNKTIAQILEDKEAQQREQQLAQAGKTIVKGTFVKNSKLSTALEFPRNSSLHLAGFIEKSKSTPSIMNTSATPPIMEPGLALNLTASVQKVMNAIPTLPAPEAEKAKAAKAQALGRASLSSSVGIVSQVIPTPVMSIAEHKVDMAEVSLRPSLPQPVIAKTPPLTANAVTVSVHSSMAGQSSAKSPKSITAVKGVEEVVNVIVSLPTATPPQTAPKDLRIVSPPKAMSAKKLLPSPPRALALSPSKGRVLITSQQREMILSSGATLHQNSIAKPVHISIPQSALLTAGKSPNKNMHVISQNVIMSPKGAATSLISPKSPAQSILNLKTTPPGSSVITPKSTSPTLVTSPNKAVSPGSSRVTAVMFPKLPEGDRSQKILPVPKLIASLASGSHASVAGSDPKKASPILVSRPQDHLALPTKLATKLDIARMVDIPSTVIAENQILKLETVSSLITTESKIKTQPILVDTKVNNAVPPRVSPGTTMTLRGSRKKETEVVAKVATDVLLPSNSVPESNSCTEEIVFSTQGMPARITRTQSRDSVESNSSERSKVSNQDAGVSKSRKMSISSVSDTSEADASTAEGRSLRSTRSADRSESPNARSVRASTRSSNRRKEQQHELDIIKTEEVVSNENAKESKMDDSKPLRASKRKGGAQEEVGESVLKKVKVEEVNVKAEVKSEAGSRTRGVKVSPVSMATKIDDHTDKNSPKGKKTTKAKESSVETTPQKRSRVKPSEKVKAAETTPVKAGKKEDTKIKEEPSTPSTEKSSPDGTCAKSASRRATRSNKSKAEASDPGTPASKKRRSSKDR